MPTQFASTFHEQAQVSVRSATSFTLDKNINQVFATAAISVTLPLDPPDGKTIQFNAVGGAITAVANTGQTLAGTTGGDLTPQNGTAQYVFDGATKSWLSSKPTA